MPHTAPQPSLQLKPTSLDSATVLCSIGFFSPRRSWLDTLSLTFPPPLPPAPPSPPQALLCSRSKFSLVFINSFLSKYQIVCFFPGRQIYPRDVISGAMSKHGNSPLSTCHFSICIKTGHK